ncbi:MAG: pyrroline-5-carboxylate reductase [Thermodesulfobacteriota bacterium]
MNNFRKIAFIGAGNMAEAMIGAILRAGLRQPGDIVISDASTDRLDQVAVSYGVTSASSNKEAAETCGIVILAVKPQMIESVLSRLADAGCFKNPPHRRIFISVAAGILLSTLESFIYSGCSAGEKALMPIIRVMPNTPALVGAGMSGMCANEQAEESDIKEAESLLSSMGDAIVFDEEKMDAVTAVSGSGPAYGFYLLEAMTEAGEKLGLARSDALRLALGAVSGAVRLVEESGKDPQTLRSKVTSPGGTTEAALSLLESHEVKDRIVDAVLAASRRSQQLSRPGNA